MKQDKAIPVNITLYPRHVEKLDQLSGDGGRSAWIQAQIDAAPLPSETTIEQEQRALRIAINILTKSMK